MRTPASEWIEAEDVKLRGLWDDGVPMELIAVRMRRGRQAVMMRLRHLLGVEKLPPRNAGRVVDAMAPPAFLKSHQRSGRRK